MKTVQFPPREQWVTLCKRPSIQAENLTDKVADILQQVRTQGDKAVYQLIERYDKASLDNLKVSNQELCNAIGQVDEQLKAAIKVAYTNIKKFHESQQTPEAVVETSPGVSCWRKSKPIEKVGLYIPGGTAPLFSTLLMLGIPAQIAGCKQIVLCTPCNADGVVNPVILYTASFLGITEIYKIGGAQAIAALAYGTETVPKVYKIFGPGNQFVTKAKELVSSQGTAIDMPAGPSEVLVIADKNADADFVAADLLSQAEHGTDSQVVLVSDNEAILNKVQQAIVAQTKELPRRDLVEQTLTNSLVIQLNNIDECIELSNVYAPEHLILAVDNFEQYTDAIVNTGSVFLGKYACESAGDYASGTNHTLPTNGYATSYSGVSLDSFVKKITFQTITAAGIQQLGPTIEIMAAAEQLVAHKNAVTIRLKKLNNEQ